MCIVGFVNYAYSLHIDWCFFDYISSALVQVTGCALSNMKLVESVIRAHSTNMY